MLLSSHAQPEAPAPELVPGEVRLWCWDVGDHGRGALAMRERSIEVWRQVRPQLARLAGVEPAQMEIRRSANGKPIAVGFAGAFSLAHDHQRALLAVSSGGCLGVDLLGPRLPSDGERLAARVLGAGELQRWRRLDASQRRMLLATRFCAIEAVVKALDWRLWSALGAIHFLRGGSIARVPLRRAQLHLHGGWHEGHSFAVASDRPIAALRWIAGPP